MTKSWSSADLHLDWDRRTGSAGLADAVRAAIRGGRLRPGTALPATRALAADLGVARGTVTRAYGDLAAEGYLSTRQGAPAVVTAAGEPHADTPRARPPDRPARWSLLPGRPDLSAFPRAEWLSATRRVLRHVPARAFDYGEPGGVRELREALAGYLARSRGVVADPRRIVVCAGYSHALQLLTTVLRDRGTAELSFEDPSLWLHHEVVRAAGGRITGVPVDDNGLRVSEVDTPAVVVTPAHQHPMGVTLAPARRAELARWARAQDATVLEDDYDGEFRFDRKPVGALQALAPEHVVYAGTASKTLAPALRLGWLVLPQALTEPVRAAQVAQGWRPPVLDQLVLADLLTSGAYARHVRRCRTRYHDRRDRLLAALPREVEVRGISAGLQLLLLLPEGQTETRVLAAARRNSLALEGLGPCWLSAGDHPQGILAGYAAPPEHAFAATVQALLRTLESAGHQS